MLGGISGEYEVGLRHPHLGYFPMRRRMCDKARNTDMIKSKVNTSISSNVWLENMVGTIIITNKT